MRPSLVVGSGISGLSAAVLLSRAGHSVHLWEQGQQSGGMLAPVVFEGVACDRGSHRVHPESHPLLRELTGAEEWLRRPRCGKLVLGGKAIAYPPRPVPFLRGLGVRTSLSMAWGFARRPGALRSFREWEADRSSVPVTDEGFEAFVVQRVGMSAYTKFYRPYVEKVWGMNPSEISRTVAKQRVSTSAPLKTFRRALTRSAAVDRTFLYPRHGMVALVERLRGMALELGVQFQSGRRFDAETDAGDYSSVLFSGHLDHLVPDAGLGHRGLYILHLAYPKGLVPDTDTWYTPELKFWFGRVSQPSKFSPSQQAGEQDILCVEIPEGRWGSKKDFLAELDTLTGQLWRAGILSEPVAPLASQQTWVPRVYPLYRRGWYNRWRVALERVAARGRVFPIGRQGLFLHCNMDHCVHISSEAVEHVLSGGSAAGWGRRCEQFLDLRVRD
jgi:UDP-galactopyranose mutase